MEERNIKQLFADAIGQYEDALISEDRTAVSVRGKTLATFIDLMTFSNEIIETQCFEAGENREINTRIFQDTQTTSGNIFVY